MSAKNKIRMYVEELFLNAPKSHRTIELKEELIANLQDKFDDLVAQGRDEPFAYDLVVSSIGDIDELILSLREKYIYDPELIDAQRQKSALFISVSVALYFLSLIPVAIWGSHDGAVFTLCGWGIATALLVYNGLTRPNYKKNENSLVEDFKEWSRSKQNRKAIRGTTYSLLWIITVIIYVAGSFLLNAWHPLWLIFLVSAAVQQVLRLFFLRGGRSDD